jgi:predicted heme/steroid binding protein
MKVFTEEELIKFDGKNGNKAFIAFKGQVYDVTGSFHWKDGKHWVVHKAGEDLTDKMNHAPHFEDVLEKFEVVGKKA